MKIQGCIYVLVLDSSISAFSSISCQNCSIDKVLAFPSSTSLRDCIASSTYQSGIGFFPSCSSYLNSSANTAKICHFSDLGSANILLINSSITVLIYGKSHQWDHFRIRIKTTVSLKNLIRNSSLEN